MASDGMEEDTEARTNMAKIVFHRRPKQRATKLTLATLLIKCTQIGGEIEKVKILPKTKRPPKLDASEMFVPSSYKRLVINRKDTAVLATPTLHIMESVIHPQRMLSAYIKKQLCLRSSENPYYHVAKGIVSELPKQYVQGVLKPIVQLDYQASTKENIVLRECLYFVVA